MYYMIYPTGDEDGDMVGFTVDDEDIHSKKWHVGRKLSTDPNVNTIFREPNVDKAIRLTIKPGREHIQLPSFLQMPIPIMSKQLFDVMVTVGVDNVDQYPAELYYADGSLASSEYYVVNILGAIAAVDMGKSVYDPDQPDSVISMSFDSVTVDQAKAHEFLVFRLAENTGAILIHEKVKRAIEASNIPLVEIASTETIAVL